MEKKTLGQERGVRTSTPTAILLAELGLQALSDEWLLGAAKFWNNLAALPPDNINRCMALDFCKSAIGPRNRRKNWAGSMYRAIIDTGYKFARFGGRRSFFCSCSAVSAKIWLLDFSIGAISKHCK